MEMNSAVLSMALTSLKPTLQMEKKIYVIKSDVKKYDTFLYKYSPLNDVTHSGGAELGGLGGL